MRAWYTRRVIRSPGSQSVHRLLISFALAGTALFAAAQPARAEGVVGPGAPLTEHAAPQVPVTRARLVAASSVQLSVNLFALYLATEQHVVLRRPSAGVGLGLRTTVGTAQPDVAVAPFIRGELGRFYLNAGWVFPVSFVIEAPRQYAFGPYAAIGAAFRLVSVGPGSLGIDLGVEANGELPGEPPVRFDAGDFLDATWLPPAWHGFLEPIVESAFLRLGVRYTFSL